MNENLSSYRRWLRMYFIDYQFRTRWQAVCFDELTETHPSKRVKIPTRLAARRLPITAHIPLRKDPIESAGTRALGVNLVVIF